MKVRFYWSLSKDQTIEKESFKFNEPQKADRLKDLLFSEWYECNIQPKKGMVIDFWSLYNEGFFDHLSQHPLDDIIPEEVLFEVFRVIWLNDKLELSIREISYYDVFD